MDIQDFIVNRDQHMRPLEYDLSESYNTLLRYLSDMGVLDNVPVGVTSESEIVSVSDAYPAPPRALNVYGKSTQDGTPTPDVPVPIMSVDSCKLCMTSNPTFYSASTDWLQGTIKLNGDTTAASNRVRSVVIPVTVGTHYHLRVNDGYLVGTRGYTDSSATSSSYIEADFHDFAQSYEWVSTGSTFLRLLLKKIDDSRLTPTMAVNASAVVSLAPISETAISLDGHSLRSLPNGTKDQLNLSYLRPSTREGWAWYSRELVQRISHRTFDGSENWNSGGNSYDGTLGTDRFSNVSGAPNTGTGSLTSLMSPSLRVASGTIWSSPNSNIWKCVRNSNQIHVVFDNDTVGINVESDTQTSRTTNIRAWLAENPITVYYPLATPVTTQLDPIELPQLPAPTATVWCDGGSAQPTLVLSYVMDLSESLSDIGESIADIISG